MTNYSVSEKSELVNIDLSNAVFLGPLYMIGVSLSGSIDPLEINPKFSFIAIGSQPRLVLFISSSSTFSKVGIDGPHKSMSSIVVLNLHVLDDDN